MGLNAVHYTKPYYRPLDATLLSLGRRVVGGI